MRKIITGIISEASGIATWVYVQKYEKAKTSYTLSTRRLRFGYEQQFSRSTSRAYYGMVGEEFTAYT